MSFKKSMVKQVAILLMAFFMGVFSAVPASAMVYDFGLSNKLSASKLKDHKQQLLIQENELSHDYDDTIHQIDELKRRSDSNYYSSTLDDLHRQLDEIYSDLRKTRMDIKDLDLKLM